MRDVAQVARLLGFGAFLGLLPLAAQAAQVDGFTVASDYAGQLQVSQQSTTEKRNDPQPTGHISGKIVDPSGVAITGGTVTLTADPSAEQKTQTGDDGQFSFRNVPVGPFHLTISSAGFGTQNFSGNVRAGEDYKVPQIQLAISEVVTEVRVVPMTVEIAQEQIKAQEKQRALGVVPNFFVSYVSDAAPLSRKQKFELAWKATIDPVSFGLTGIIAGVEQAQNDFSGYGQGAQGYAKRYGAAFTNQATNTLIGSAILPSILKQDPRYFYKGTGSKRSRFLYAVVNSVVSKGDNGKWQPNYSGVLGGLASGGISNLYYPAKDREGFGLTMENTLIGIGTTAATNILQEFLIRKLTPGASKTEPNQSGGKATNPIATIWDSIIRDNGGESYGR